MRASRLLSILTTLQARGQVTAPELADACEVSVRTIYRDIDALGLVLKGGSWYLAGQVDGSVRTYRVARVLDCNVLDERFVRPADFDLAAYWQAATIRLEAEMHPNTATVRLSPFGIKLLNTL